MIAKRKQKEIEENEGENFDIRAKLKSKFMTFMKSSSKTRNVLSMSKDEDGSTKFESSTIKPESMSNEPVGLDNEKKKAI